MLTEKDYCDYGQIVELEQLGMPIEIDFACGIENGQLVKTKFYPNPPSLYEAQKWLREEKKIEANASFDKMEDGWIAFIQRLNYPDLMGTDFLTPVFNSYEDALLEIIKEAVKLLKEELNEET